jgi:hypothetical protein
MKKLLTAVVSVFALSVAMAAVDNEHEADRVKIIPIRSRCSRAERNPDFG